MATIGTLVVALVSDTARFEQGIIRARRQSDELERAMRQLEKGGLDRLTAGMTASAAQTSKVSDWMRRLGDASSQVSGTVTQTARAGEAMAAGFRKAENAIVDMGLQAIGLDGKLARVVEGLLLLGVGGTVTLAVTAGLAVIGGLIRARTEEMDALSRSSNDARQRLAEAFRERQASSTEGLQRDLVAEQRRFALLSQTLQGQGPSAKLLESLAESSAAIQELQARIETLADRNHKATEKITYDWGRVRNVFTDEITDRLTRESAKMFEQRQRAIQEMLSSRQGPIRFDQSPDELAREVERAANRAGDSAGRVTLERIAKTAQARQQALAQFTEEVWKSAARNIQSATASTFESIFNGQIKSLASFARSVVGIVQRAVAEILAAQTVSGLGPFLRGAFGGGSGIPAAPDTSFLGPANTGIPTGGFSRAQPVVHQYITYAPTVHAIDAQGVQQFYRRTRGSLIAELARAAQDSRLVPASVSR